MRKQKKDEIIKEKRRKAMGGSSENENKENAQERNNVLASMGEGIISAIPVVGPTSN